MVKRFSSAPKSHVLVIDELLLGTVASAHLFATPDPAAFLALPHAFPGKWEQARQLLEPSRPSHHPHMQTVPYHDAHGITIASWHHGAHYQTVISGRPETILHYVTMTENERERYTLECIQQNAAGNEVLAVAVLYGAQPVDSITALNRHHDFLLIGSLAAHCSASPVHLAKIRRLIERGEHLTLLSREHPSYIASFANRHGLFADGAVYVDAAELPHTLTDIQLTELLTATGIGHCAGAPLREYFTDTHTILSPAAQSLIY